MATEKRKTITSTDVKRRYNEKTYTVVRAAIDKDLVSRFKAKVIENGDSIAGVVRDAIREYLGDKD